MNERRGVVGRDAGVPPRDELGAALAFRRGDVAAGTGFDGVERLHDFVADITRADVEQPVRRIRDGDGDAGHAA